MSIPTRLRWKIIYPLNKITPWCWTDLVSWALDGERESFQSARWNYETCKTGPDTQREGACYCGKYQTTEMEKSE